MIQEVYCDLHGAFKHRDRAEGRLRVIVLTCLLEPFEPGQQKPIANMATSGIINP